MDGRQWEGVTAELRSEHRCLTPVLPLGAHRQPMRAATQALGSFERPVLVVWDSEGKMMPNEQGRRLAASFPSGRLVELPDCYTLIPLDRPLELAAAIHDFA
jgi:pimeloyl-ACP methyl ester carboxylesterase